MHSSIVGTCSLMDIDVKTIITLHLQSCLNTSLREYCYRTVAPVHSLLHTSTNLREFSLLSLLLLSIIVTRKPPCSMVACHSKLRTFLLDKEIDKIVLLRELIAEAYTIVIHTETDNDLTICSFLGQCLAQLIIIITNSGSLTPYRLPGLIKCGVLFFCNRKAIHQIGLFQTFRCMLVLCEFKT